MMTKGIDRVPFSPLAAIRRGSLLLLLDTVPVHLSIHFLLHLCRRLVPPTYQPDCPSSDLTHLFKIEGARLSR